MIGASASGPAQKSLLPPPLHSSVQDLQLRFETGRATSRVYAETVAQALVKTLNETPGNRLPSELVHGIVHMAWRLDATRDARGVVRGIGAAMNLMDAPQDLAKPASLEFAERVGRRLGWLTGRKGESAIPAELATAIVDQALLIDQHTSPIGSVRSMGAAFGVITDPAASALCEMMRCIEEKRPKLEALERWRTSSPEHRKSVEAPDFFSVYDDLGDKLHEVRLNLPTALHQQIDALIRRLGSDALSKDPVSFLQNFRLLSSLVDSELQPVPGRRATSSAHSEDGRKQTSAERQFTAFRQHLALHLRFAHEWVAATSDIRMPGHVQFDINQLIRCIDGVAELLASETLTEARRLADQISQAFRQQQPVAFGTAWVSLHHTIMGAHHEMNRERWAVNEQVG